MSKYVASIDQGTTSTRCMLFNHEGEVVGAHQLEHEQIYPKPGWVEHDAEEIFQNVLQIGPAQRTVGSRFPQVLCPERKRDSQEDNHELK